MGMFAEDLLENDCEDYNYDVMCTGCGEVVKEENTFYEDGRSCCIHCK